MKEDIAEKSKVTPLEVDNTNLLLEETSTKKPSSKARKSKKKNKVATPVTRTEAVAEPLEQAKQVKKKKTRTKKKSEENKENQVPEALIEAQTADTAAMDAKKVKKTKKKESSAKPNGLRQGEFTIDYQGLHDALKDSFSLDKPQGEVYFAPLIGKVKKSEPKFSMSSNTASGSESRNSNQNAPSAKNRHAEIPPPSFMTQGSIKKKTSKSVTTDKSTIEKIKERKTRTKKVVSKVTEKETEQQVEKNAEKSIETQDVKKDIKKEDKKDVKKEEKKDEKKDVKKEEKKDEKKDVKKDEKKDEKKDVKKDDKRNVKKAVDTNKIGTPVEPVILPTKKKTSRERKSSKKGVEKNAKNDYCHPNDIIFGKGRVRYEPYVDPKICLKKIAEGKYHEGLLRINKRSRTDAYVTCDTLDADIFINGQRDRNRALDGDIVVIELLDLEEIWAKKKESMIQKREQRHSTALERPPQEEGEDDKGKPKYVGKVVSITATNKNQTCSGTLSLQQRFADKVENVEVKNVRLAWFKPVDPRTPLVAIPLKNAPADILKNEEKYKDLLMVCKINRWPIDSSSPFGSIVRELGHIGNIVAETQAVLMDNNIVEKDFGSKALKGLPPTPWSIQQSDIDKRRDLRQTRIFTIDPATAKDLDDAVHVTKLGEDSFEIGVHIADVSHFVHQHTALDHEAFDRGTSTYLCDRVIPMLPSLLCEQLCSLNPGVERLAFSVIWQMDGAGNIKDTWYGKSVIKSCAKLAYEDAQSVIENKGLPKTADVKEYTVPQVEQDIQYLFKISKQMRERRFSNGALSINSIRLSFRLNEDGEPCEVAIYEQKDANRLIEEFMLCANMSVAEKISKHYPHEALLRQHSPPHEKSLNEFIRIAENLGYHFDASSAGSLQKSFNAIENEDVKAVLRLLAVKPMQRAKYFCTGSTDKVNFRHYALNVPLYTHFTSPIRRFADIVVHRQLEAALSSKESCGYKKEDVQKAASHCNDRKEGAKNSQDMNIQLYLSHYLHVQEEKTKQPIIRTAIITQVLKDCFEILVPDFGLEKRVHMDALPIIKFVHDPHKNALSAYWKEGVECNREYDASRKLDENYIEPSGTQIHTKGGKSAQDIPQELVNENLIDKEKKTQRFEPFSKIQVRIEVNVERSPPVVNIYPVNPFMYCIFQKIGKSD